MLCNTFIFDRRVRPNRHLYVAFLVKTRVKPFPYSCVLECVLQLIFVILFNIPVNNVMQAIRMSNANVGKFIADAIIRE